jgi:hypothetical protein
LLLLLAIAGPWTVEEINVPAEFPCSSDYFRLEGDFCGVPISGFQIFSFLITGLVSMSIRLLSGEAAFSPWAREILTLISLFLLFLPIVTTLILIVRGEQRRRRRIHALALGLTLCLFAGLSLLGLPGFSLPLYASWGIWLYIVLMLGALIFELLIVTREKTRNKRPG